MEALPGRDLGEDWIVPKAAVRYLVAREVPGGALLTAYTGDGQLAGERFAGSFEELEELLHKAHAGGRAEVIRSIPEGTPSALEALRDPDHP